jgi:hypothetical protein
MNRQQHFQDVESEIDETRGVLDGGAFKNHERVIEKPNKQGAGYDFRCNCGNCNRQSDVTIPWSELIVASVRQLPCDEATGTAWITQNGYMYPPVTCQACGQLLSVPITPDKAERFLKAGISSGAIRMEQVAQGQQATLRQAASLRR